MRAAMLLTALGAVAVPVLGAPPKGYTNRFDSIDIEKVLSNSRITNRYIDCLLDRVQCTAEGRELKSEYFVYLYKYLFVIYHWQGRISSVGSTRSDSPQVLIRIFVASILRHE